MTKSELREIAKLEAVCRHTNIDILARAYSALIRSAMTKKSRNEIICAASNIPAVIKHPEFII